MNERITRFVMLAAALACLASCTSVYTTSATSKAGPRSVFATQEDISDPYESLGPIQATRRGVLLFGFIDLAGTHLEAGFEDTLFPEVRRLGGDGVINVRYQMTQYTTFTRIASIFVPLPSEVTITGEVVKLRRGGPRASLPSTEKRK